jgi:hypothetical protein
VCNALLADRSITESLGLKKCVCARCIEESWLASYIKANASENECDYCGRKSKRRPIAVPLEELTPHIVERIDSCQ